MAKVKDVFKLFGWANYITQDNNFDVKLWKYEPLLSSKLEWFGREPMINLHRNLEINEFEDKDVRFSIAQRPIKYDKYLNKIGQFWDIDSRCKHIGILTKVNNQYNYRFENENGARYLHFEPLKYDENLFYHEENEDNSK